MEALLVYDQNWNIFTDEFVKKANLRDLIAATGLVISLKLDSNHCFFSPCDLQIWWMTWKYNRAILLHYTKLCASFQIHLWIQTRATVRKHSIRVKIGNFVSRVTLKFDGWSWKTKGHLFYAMLSFVHHFIAICEFKLKLQARNAQFGSKLAIFCPVIHWNLWLTFKNNREPLLCCFNFVHHFIAISDFELKLQSKNAQFGSKSTIFVPCDLENWQMTLKNNRAPALCFFKLCASFYSHQWFQT